MLPLSSLPAPNVLPYPAHPFESAWSRLGLTGNRFSAVTSTTQLFFRRRESLPRSSVMPNCFLSRVCQPALIKGSIRLGGYTGNDAAAVVSNTRNYRCLPFNAERAGTGRAL